jgi:hypothetical protein
MLIREIIVEDYAADLISSIQDLLALMRDDNVEVLPQEPELDLDTEDPGDEEDVSNMADKQAMKDIEDDL